MPSVAEVRKISLRALHKSATQYWEKQNGGKQERKFQRTASAPSIKDTDRNSRPTSRQSGMFEMGDQESLGGMSSVSESDEEIFSEDIETRPYQSISFGFQTKATHEQHAKMTDIMGILYNGRTRRFFLLDSRGISSWLPVSDAPDAVKKELYFPKYKTKLLRSVIFCKKYNVYFTICSDFTLKVYNKDFHETCKTENKSMRSILHLIFNPVTDELISSGVAGTIVWKYKQTQRSLFDTIKPMANYELQLHAEYPDVGGTWCTKVELITSVQYLFFCSEMGLYAYDAKEFRKLFVIHNAHSAALTCVGYSLSNRLLLTGSVDCEVKVWGASGGHICTLRGHSRAISSIIIHPDIPGLVFTSSLDGTIKVWSLDTMDLFNSLSLYSEGINWMDLTDDGRIWCANLRKVTVFNFHAVVSFWGHARCRIVSLDILEHQGKTRRLMAVGEDGSVRFFSQAKSDDTLAVCTVLPPPVVSLLDSVRDVTHSRFNHLVFVLINQMKLWVYTSKTDPACRIAEWDIPTMLKEGMHSEKTPEKSLSTTSISSMAIRNFEKKKATHRCTQILTGRTNPSVCCCVLTVFSENGFQYDTPLGTCSARSRHLLVLGLEDGRIVFADQKKRGLLYSELQVNKEAIVAIKHKAKQNWLVTQCNNHQHSIFQIWKLPELELQYTVFSANTTTCFAVLDDLLVTGHSNGHVNVQSIYATDESVLAGDEQNAEKQPEHRGKVIDVKSCRKRGIFCSSSADGVIKIWSLDKVLLSEIRLGEELSSCNFLNDHGDLVIGWKRHLFVINHKTLDLQDAEEEASEKFEKESDIYEDPAIKYESVLKPSGKTSTITMQKYLVPYGFVATEKDDNMDLKLNLPANDGDAGSERSDGTQCALTDTYLSPASSVASFGIIDALFALKSPNTERTKGSNELVLPEFGVSPGTTPAESVTSASSEEYSIIPEEDLIGDGPERLDDDDVFEPPWLKKEEPLDIGKKLSTGVLVAKAYKKMKKKKGGDPIPEEPQKSRFAGTQLDSAGLMRAGMSAVIAVEKMKKKKKLSSSDRPPSGKMTVKKTRRPSDASNQRKSFIPTEIPLDPMQIKDDSSAGDFSPRDVDEIVEKTAAKLKEMGLKMTPTRKVGFESTQHHQIPNSAASLHRKKQAITGHAAKHGVHVSSKLKRKISKSATVGRRKSSITKAGAHHINIVTNVPGTTPLLEPLTKNRLAHLGEVETPGTQSTESGEAIGNSKTPVTQVHMTYKHSAAMHHQKKPEHHSIEAQESTGKEQNVQQKESDELTVSSSTLSSKPFHTFSKEDMKETHSKVEEEKEREMKKLVDEEQDIDYLNVRDLLEKCRAGGEDESGDEDELAIPNLLEYDFHAIYKKDGLQFDEKWQDRMLERYLLLKMQKKQRQEAAMNKRIFLEQERHFRLLASHPELLEKYNEPWSDDPGAMANYILNSALMRGDAASPTNPLYSDLHSNHTESRLSKRPTTVASNAHRSGQDGFSDKESCFRLSTRPKSCDSLPDPRENALQQLKRTKNSALPPATPTNSNTTLKAKSSTTLQNLLADRPRSSTSIPGKTRYILIKPEKERRPDKVASPTKLEQQLLRRRFPSQHTTVMKSLGRIDEASSVLGGDESYNNIHEPNGRAGTPVDERAIQTAPSMSRKLQNMHKSETDTLSFDRNAFSGILGNSEHSLKQSHAWKSSFSDAYINPLDIVKRTPSVGSSPMKVSLRSIHA